MRIRLDLPQRVLFKLPVTVRVTDMNYGGHLGNDRLLAYAQECRDAWFKSVGFTELDVDGCNTIMADAAIQFLQEGYAGDELDVVLYLGDQHKYGLDLFYTVLLADKKELARMKTAILFRNEKDELCAPPKVFLEKLNK